MLSFPLSLLYIEYKLLLLRVPSLALRAPETCRSVGTVSFLLPCWEDCPVSLLYCGNLLLDITEVAARPQAPLPDSAYLPLRPFSRVPSPHFSLVKSLDAQVLEANVTCSVPCL